MSQVEPDVADRVERKFAAEDAIGKVLDGLEASRAEPSDLQRELLGRAIDAVKRKQFDYALELARQAVLGDDKFTAEARANARDAYPDLRTVSDLRSALAEARGYPA